MHDDVIATFYGSYPAGDPEPANGWMLSLDLRPVDFHKADGRGIVDGEPPGYSLHRWKDGKLVTHFQPVGDWTRLAVYTEKLVPMMEGLERERR